jgi:cell wall assembly regulator SMI1
MTDNEAVARWLKWFAAHAEDVIASLAPKGAALAVIAPAMESAVALYAAHDGQSMGEDFPPPVYENYRWMSLAEIAETRESLDGMANVGEWDDDKHKVIDWWVPGWVPLLTDDNSNYLCIDTVGSFGGNPGQMLEFIHDDASRKVFAPSFDAWFAAWTASLEAGAWTRDEGMEPTPAVAESFTAAMPGFPRKHAARKQKIAAPKKPKKSTKPDPLLAVFKNRMSASEIVEAIAAGANVHARDADGKTPLHHAMGCGNELPAQALLAAGAEVNAVTKRRETPLHLAALAHQRTTAALITVLVKAGADTSLRDVEDNPPIAYALTIEALRALLDAGADPAITVGGQPLPQYYKQWGRSPAMIELVTPRDG